MQGNPMTAYEVLPKHLLDLPEQSSKCPNCHREIIRTWKYCPSCGKYTSEQIVRRLCMTDAENAVQLLNGLINYHERAVGFRPDDKDDRYISALRYALLLVESCFEQENGDTV